MVRGALPVWPRTIDTTAAPPKLHAGPRSLVSLLATTAAVTTAAEAPAATIRSPGLPSLKKQTGSGGPGEGPELLWPLPPQTMSDLGAAAQQGQILPRRHLCPLNSMRSAEAAVRGGTRKGKRDTRQGWRNASGSGAVVAERGWQ